MDFIHKKTKKIVHAHNAEHIKFFQSNSNYTELKKEKKKAEESASSTIMKGEKKNDIKNKDKRNND